MKISSNRLRNPVHSPGDGYGVSARQGGRRTRSQGVRRASQAHLHTQVRCDRSVRASSVSRLHVLVRRRGGPRSPWNPGGRGSGAQVRSASEVPRDRLRPRVLRRIRTGRRDRMPDLLLQRSVQDGDVSRRKWSVQVNFFVYFKVSRDHLEKKFQAGVEKIWQISGKRVFKLFSRILFPELSNRTPSLSLSLSSF